MGGETALVIVWEAKTSEGASALETSLNSTCTMLPGSRTTRSRYETVPVITSELEGLDWKAAFLVEPQPPLRLSARVTSRMQ